VEELENNMNNKLTYEELHRQLMYNPWNGLFYRKIKSNRNVRIGDIAGYTNPDGYVYISINGEYYLAHRLAWFYVKGYWPENIIDHKYRTPSNNKWNNLRHVSQSCNIRNSKKSTRNTSGVVGVCFHKLKQKWQADIKLVSKRKYLGMYFNFIDAVKARWEAEKKYEFPNCCTISTAYVYLKKENLI